jgi:formylglycine-generating enzyme required for sulfatase activity
MLSLLSHLPVTVKEWADFMKEKGITRVIGLLNDSEIDTYEKPPVETLK